MNRAGRLLAMGGHLLMLRPLPSVQSRKLALSVKPGSITPGAEACALTHLAWVHNREGRAAMHYAMHYNV
jgi:hypothetical protein